jgi:hypothetical protein
MTDKPDGRAHGALVNRADHEAIGSWLLDDRTVTFRVLVTPRTGTLADERRWMDIARWTQATDTTVYSDDAADWSAARTETFQLLLDPIRQMIGPQVFDPATAVERFRELTAQAKSATSDRSNGHLHDSAMHLRKAWELWTGKDSLRDLAFGEPSE